MPDALLREDRADSNVSNDEFFDAMDDENDLTPPSGQCIEDPPTAPPLESLEEHGRCVIDSGGKAFAGRESSRESTISNSPSNSQKFEKMELFTSARSFLKEDSGSGELDNFCNSDFFTSDQDTECVIRVCSSASSSAQQPAQHGQGNMPPPPPSFPSLPDKNNLLGTPNDSKTSEFESRTRETPKEVQEGYDQEIFVTPKHENTSKSQISRNNLNLDDILPCEITSPLEALYLFSSISVENEEVENLTLNRPKNRTSVSDDADPVGEAPLSPPIDDSTAGDVRRGSLDSLSTDDSSTESSGSSSEATGADKFRIVNKDTGSIHDMRVVMKEIDEIGSSIAVDTRYSFLPTRDELEIRRMGSSPKATKLKVNTESETLRNSLNGYDSGDNSLDSQTSSHTNTKVKTSASTHSVTALTVKKSAVKLRNLRIAMKTNVRKGVEGLKSSHQNKRSRKRAASSSDMLPSNAIHVRSSRQNYKSLGTTKENDVGTTTTSPFNPMLLITTIPEAHKGPAWCAVFSPDGRYLATGGEDGTVCIWAVAPSSKNMHPDGLNGVSKQNEESNNETFQFGDSAKVIVEDNSIPSNDGNHVERSENEGECTVDDPGSDEKSAPSLTTIGTGPELATNLHLLSSEPLQRYDDHSADVIDLSWSHSNFLLSASLDCSVCLYHYSKTGCLHIFKHANLVASCSFHPNDDRYFISGGIDKKLRLWSIPDGRVKEWAQAPDVITCTRFTPDGKYAVAGLFRGQVYFYNVDGLIYYTQVACRNRSGKHRMGKKVTGISFVRGEREDWLLKKKTPASSGESPLSDSNNSLSKLSDTGTRVARRLVSSFVNQRDEALRYTERMLVSTNDSRVRLFSLNDFCVIRKYKGHSNYSMQIRARISESGEYIASGSESGHVFIWNTLDKNRLPKNTANFRVQQTHDKTKSSDYFEASKAHLPIVTDSVFFPLKSMKESLVSSSIFPFSLEIDHVNEDMSSASILTLDYDGTIRVFLRKSCIDALLDVYQGTMT